MKTIITLPDRRRGGGTLRCTTSMPCHSSPLQAVFLSVTALSLTISAQAFHQWMWCLQVAGAGFEPLKSHFTTGGAQIPFLTSLIIVLHLPCKTVTIINHSRWAWKTRGNKVPHGCHSVVAITSAAPFLHCVQFRISKVLLMQIRNPLIAFYHLERWGFLYQGVRDLKCQEDKTAPNKDLPAPLY